MVSGPMKGLKNCKQNQSPLQKKKSPSKENDTAHQKRQKMLNNSYYIALENGLDSNAGHCLDPKRKSYDNRIQNPRGKKIKTARKNGIWESYPGPQSCKTNKTLRKTES